VDFWVDLKIGDKVLHGDIPVAPSPEQNVFVGKTPDGKDMSLSGEKWWTRVASRQIETNSYSEGWIVAVFKNITQEEVKSQRAIVVVTCSDITGHKASGVQGWGDYPPFAPFGLGDIQKLH